jgi:alkylation response protein AidB-like acyl-CoA dehydrogenase
METLLKSSARSLNQELMHTAIEIGAVISRNVTEEENARRLSAATVNALKEAGFLKLYLPESLGGLEVDPVTTAYLVEEVAKHNTAAAWCMMVANTSAWWSSRATEKAVTEIYQDNADAIIAGTFHPPMKAEPVEGGYVINGRNPLASNVHEASRIFMTAFVMEGDHIKMNNGFPQVIGVLLNPEDCQIIDTWHTLGMKATDSNDVVADNVFVADHLVFPISPVFEPNSFYTGKLYQYAAMGASIASLIAPIPLAVAQNAIAELKLLADKKTPMGSMTSIRERGAVQRKLGLAQAMVQSSRAYLYQTLSDKWNKTLTGESLTLEDKAALLLAATHTNQSCMQAVDLMYSAAGSTAIYSRSKLEHYFTDAQVIRQHGFANESRYETAAQVYFGMPPDLPVLAF